jgi:hypothetical protein
MIFAQIWESLYNATDSTQHRPWKSSRSSGSWEIPHLLWNLQVHITMFRGLPLILNLNQMNPVHDSQPISIIFTSIPSSRCICFCLCLPSSLCSSGVPTQIPYTFLPYACHIPKYHLVSSVTELFKMMQVVGSSVKLAVVIQTVTLQRLSLNYVHLFTYSNVCLSVWIYLKYFYLPLFY